MLATGYWSDWWMPPPMNWALTVSSSAAKTSSSLNSSPTKFPRATTTIVVTIHPCWIWLCSTLTWTPGGRSRSAHARRDATSVSAWQRATSAGPGGSRMTVMLSGALRGAAAKVKEKMFKIASHLLEANQEDLELREGRVWVRGTESSLSIADIGMKAYWHKFDLPPGMESGL